MKLFLLNLTMLLVMPQAAFASDTADYKQCVVAGYYALASGPKNCDFSNLSRNIQPVMGQCDLNFISKIDQSNITSLVEQLKSFRIAALTDLNTDLNTKLHGCGYEGKIEITPTGGHIEMYRQN